VNPLALKWLGIGAGLLALLGLVAWLVQNLEAAGEAKATAKESARAAAWAASTAAAQRSQDAKQLENLNEANRFNDQRLADARELDDLVRMRKQQSAASGRSGWASAASAPGSSAAGLMPATADLSADMCQGRDEALAQLAEFADCLWGVSDLCAKDYGALTH
jgi:hypothetical protein